MNKLELQSLYDKREELCLVFAQKCLKNPKIKHLFPANNKTHLMETRTNEHFYVNHANTTQLMKSPVIYMQRLLNMEVQRKQRQEKLWCV